MPSREWQGAQAPCPRFPFILGSCGVAARREGQNNEDHATSYLSRSAFFFFLKLRTFSVPISPVFCTCVPPQGHPWWETKRVRVHRVCCTETVNVPTDHLSFNGHHTSRLPSRQVVELWRGESANDAVCRNIVARTYAHRSGTTGGLDLLEWNGAHRDGPSRRGREKITNQPTSKRRVCVAYRLA